MATHDPDFTIRLGDDDDYPAIAAVLDASNPEERASARDLKESDDAIRLAGLVCRRTVAEVDGEIVGYAGYGAVDWSADDGLWAVMVRVVPALRRHGIGRSLHEYVDADAVAEGVPRLFADVPEADPSGASFARELGYTRAGVEFQSWLDVPGSTPSSWSRRSPDKSGVRIETLADLRRAVPDWFERLHELYSQLEADIPVPLALKAVPVETFRHRHIDAEPVIPEAFLIAVAEDRWVGLTELRRIELEPTWLQQELTGVVRTHRRRGIATRLKQVGIRWASDHGYERIRTQNSSLNAGMLAVNEQLGFERGAPYGLWLRDG